MSEVSTPQRNKHCEKCGSIICFNESVEGNRRRAHEDLVRSVALGTDLVISGSYDCTVKVFSFSSDMLFPSDVTYCGHMYAFDRYGIARAVCSLPISSELTLAEFSALDLITQRSVKMTSLDHLSHCNILF